MDRIVVMLNRADDHAGYEVQGQHDKPGEQRTVGDSRSDQLSDLGARHVRYALLIQSVRHRLPPYDATTF
jgi:hypothetical protein